MRLRVYLEAERGLGKPLDDAAVEQAVLGDGQVHVLLELRVRTVHNHGRRGFRPRPQQSICVAIPAWWYTRTSTPKIPQTHGIYIFMYGHTCSKSMDQPGKVANPARGPLNRENEYFPVRVRA